MRNGLERDAGPRKAVVGDDREHHGAASEAQRAADVNHDAERLEDVAVGDVSAQRFTEGHSYGQTEKEGRVRWTLLAPALG